MLTKTVRTLSSSIPKNRLDGTIAVVTASTEGIGFAIAKRLAQEGAKVVISSRKQANVDKALAQLAFEGLKKVVVGTVCHVNKAEDRKKMFEKAKILGGLDILVSNAGINPEICRVLDTSEDAWDKTFQTNLKSAFLLAKEALPLLRESSCGRIMFVSSIAAYYPMPLLGTYSVTKTALVSLAKNISLDLASENITVNCIAPGTIQTKLADVLIKKVGPLRDEFLKKIPMNRFGKVEEISGIAAFLASDDAKYLTGETIVVSGGLLSHL